jgi:hypothetical protein
MIAKCDKEGHTIDEKEIVIIRNAGRNIHIWPRWFYTSQEVTVRVYSMYNHR